MFHKNFKSRCFFSKTHFMDSQINKVHSLTIFCVVLSDLMGFWDASISTCPRLRGKRPLEVGEIRLNSGGNRPWAVLEVARLLEWCSCLLLWYLTIRKHLWTNIYNASHAQLDRPNVPDYALNPHGLMISHWKKLVKYFRTSRFLWNLKGWLLTNRARFFTIT